MYQHEASLDEESDEVDDDNRCIKDNDGIGCQCAAEQTNQQNGVVYECSANGEVIIMVDESVESPMRNECKADEYLENGS